LALRRGRYRIESTPRGRARRGGGTEPEAEAQAGAVLASLAKKNDMTAPTVNPSQSPAHARLSDEARLVLEFDRQVANLEQLGYPRLARMPKDAFARLFVPLRARLAELPAELVEAVIPFVLVLDPELVSAEQSMPLVEQNGRRGVVDMNPTQPSAFSPIDPVDLPEGPAYLLTDVDTGKETLNVTPDNALSLITRNGRSPLTIEEGIAVLTHNPGVLRSMNAFSLLGSRRGDKRVPALWTSKGRPRLGWCWAGNPHAWLGSASCASRLGAGLASRGALTAGTAQSSAG
jgi:hypothetical protein